MWTAAIAVVRTSGSFPHPQSLARVSQRTRGPTRGPRSLPRLRRGPRSQDSGVVWCHLGLCWLSYFCIVCFYFFFFFFSYLNDSQCWLVLLSISLMAPLMLKAINHIEMHSMQCFRLVKEKKKSVGSISFHRLFHYLIKVKYISLPDWRSACITVNNGDNQTPAEASFIKPKNMCWIQDIQLNGLTSRPWTYSVLNINCCAYQNKHSRIKFPLYNWKQKVQHYSSSLLYCTVLYSLVHFYVFLAPPNRICIHQMTCHKSSITLCFH